MAAFRDGSLEAWLDACCYEREADMVRQPPREESSGAEQAVILHNHLKSQKQYEFCLLSEANDDAMEAANAFFDSNSEAEKSSP